jgi:hypothetical protein
LTTPLPLRCKPVKGLSENRCYCHLVVLDQSPSPLNSVQFHYFNSTYNTQEIHIIFVTVVIFSHCHNVYLPTYLPFPSLSISCISSFSYGNFSFHYFITSDQFTQLRFLEMSSYFLRQDLAVLLRLVLNLWNQGIK